MFMYGNKARTDQLRKNVENIKVEIKSLQDTISQYDSYLPTGEDSSLSLIKLLNSTGDFLS